MSSGFRPIPHGLQSYAHTFAMPLRGLLWFSIVPHYPFLSACSVPNDGSPIWVWGARVPEFGLTTTYRSLEIGPVVKLRPFPESEESLERSKVLGALGFQGHIFNKVASCLLNRRPLWISIGLALRKIRWRSRSTLTTCQDQTTPQGAGLDDFGYNLLEFGTRDH